MDRLSDMENVMVIIGAWFLVAALASLGIGRSIRLADHMEGTAD